MIHVGALRLQRVNKIQAVTRGYSDQAVSCRSTQVTMIQQNPHELPSCLVVKLQLIACTKRKVQLNKIREHINLDCQSSKNGSEVTSRSLFWSEISFGQISSVSHPAIEKYRSNNITAAYASLCS